VPEPLPRAAGTRLTGIGTETTRAESQDEMLQMTGQTTATRRPPRWRWGKVGLALVAAFAVSGVAAAAAPAPEPAAAPGTAPAAAPAPAPTAGAATGTAAGGEATAQPGGGTAATPGTSTPVVSAPTTQYDAKLRELEERVVTLKEKIFRSKTRLLILKEQVLNDVIAEAKAVIIHENDMGPSFELQRVIYHLDGEKIWFQDNSQGKLDEKDWIEFFNGNVLPGNHVLSVEMVYRGDSSVFSYLKDYVFKLRANFTFYATKGKITTIRAIGYLKGDITYDITKRPSITFKVDQVGYTKDSVEQPKAEGGE